MLRCKTSDLISSNFVSGVTVNSNAISSDKNCFNVLFLKEISDLEAKRQSINEHESKVKSIHH